MNDAFSSSDFGPVAAATPRILEFRLPGSTIEWPSVPAPCQTERVIGVSRILLPREILSVTDHARLTLPYSLRRMTFLLRA